MKTTVSICVYILVTSSFTLGPLTPLSAANDNKISSNDWVFIDNGQIRLGVIKSSGAGIGYLSSSNSKTNLLDHYDRGRLIQQSYYGGKDGSLWNGKPWNWNPVQGGGYRNEGSKVAELRTTPDTLYAKTIPTHWATGASLTNVAMEEWITLTGRVAKVHFKMTYTGSETHPVTHQEIPAIFLAPELDTLVLYDGKAPWTGAPLSRSQPGFPNEGRTISEHWAAYVNTNNVGLGSYVPVADKITCYRYRAKGTSLSACSYLAPLTEFAIKPGTIFEYDVFLVPGTVDIIRQTFEALHKAPH